MPLGFRGAEGFGRNASGGRGGIIVPVTTLSDNGNNSSPTAGSLRAALRMTEPRHIVFDVAGQINHTNSVNVTSSSMSNFTLHGHIAPGDGVTLRGRQIAFRNLENFVVRFLRSRPGAQGTEEDCFDAKQCANFIIDHCSLSWSIDECASLSGVRDATMQWCILAEALNNAGHVSAPHSYGSLSAGKNLSFYGNLFANNLHRNPRFSATDQVKAPFVGNDWLGSTDLRNNIMFNWGGGAITGGGGNDPRQKFNIVRNLFIPGPAFVPSSNFPAGCFCQATALGGTYGEYHLFGNWMEDYPTVSADNKLGFRTSPSLSESARYALLSETPLFSAEVYERIYTEKEVLLELITDYVGSSLKRDAVDARIIDYVLNRPSSYAAASNGSGTGGLIDDPSDRGGYPTMATTPALPTSTAGDYISDAWKSANGFDAGTNYEGVINEATGYDIFELYSMDVAKSVAEYYEDPESPDPGEGGGVPPVIVPGEAVRLRMRFPSQVIA